VSAAEERAAEASARALGRTAPAGPGVEVLGPAPAPFALLRGRHRRRLLLKTAKGVDLQGVVRGWLSRTEIPRNVRVEVDVDPVSFM